MDEPNKGHKGHAPDPFVPDEQRWNRNIHYHPLLLSLADSGRVLEVGCGGGLLARQFASRVSKAVGIDPDVASIELARSETTDPNVSYVLGDVLTHDFGPASFDAVVSVATIHHFDAAEGLRRFAELTKPGGYVGVVGIGRSDMPRDLPRDAVSFASTLGHRITRRKTLWDHSAPIVWPPPHSDREMRDLSAAVLPGSQFRRRLQGRYSIIWQAPGNPAD
jgi:SAM-dependent methyltransferase